MCLSQQGLQALKNLLINKVTISICENPYTNDAKVFFVEDVRLYDVVQCQ